MPRSIQTWRQYEAAKNKWDRFQSAQRSGAPSLQGAEPAPPQPPDDYPDRLAKYIPAEVVTLYLALMAATAQAQGDPDAVRWLAKTLGTGWLSHLNLGAFLAGLLATPLYLRFRLRVRSAAHLLVCIGSFVIWAVAIPDGMFKDWPPLVRGFLLPLYTFAVAFYEPKPNKAGET